MRRYRSRSSRDSRPEAANIGLGPSSVSQVSEGGQGYRAEKCNFWRVRMEDSVDVESTGDGRASNKLAEHHGSSQI